MLFVSLVAFLTTPRPAAQSRNEPSSTSQETLMRYVGELSKNPSEKKKTGAPTQKKTTSVPSFVGNWFFKESVRGKERTLQAFEISKKANGDIVATAPRRAADYVPTIRSFTMTDTTMKIEIHWRMTSVLGYWKIETYDLTFSENGKNLTGSYFEKSAGGGTIERHRTLFRR